MGSQKSRRKPALPPILVEEIGRARFPFRGMPAAVKRALLHRYREDVRQHIAAHGIDASVPVVFSVPPRWLSAVERRIEVLEKVREFRAVGAARYLPPAQRPGRPSDDSLRRDVAEFLRERGYANAPKPQKTRIRRDAGEAFGVKDSLITKAWAEFGPKL